MATAQFFNAWQVNGAATAAARAIDSRSDHQEAATTAFVAGDKANGFRQAFACTSAAGAEGDGIRHSPP